MGAEGGTAGKMKTIENVDEALRLFEENSIKQAQTLDTGNYKVGNKCFDKGNWKCWSHFFRMRMQG